MKINHSAQQPSFAFHAMSFALALLGAIAVRKNTRDVQVARPMVVNADAVCIADASATSNRMEQA